MYEFFFSFVFFWINLKMQLCGCLPVGIGSARDEEKQAVKKYSLKRGMFSDVMLELNFIVRRYTGEWWWFVNGNKVRMEFCLEDLGHF